MAQGELEQSEELRAVTDRMWTAWMRGDVESVLGRFSFSPGISGFGTDSTEVFDDPVRLERYTRAEFEAMDGPWPFGPAEIEAWREGDIGWSTVRAAVLDAARPLRVSYVFRLERDDWRVVHQHWSVGVSNEEVLGVRLPLEVLAEAVEDEKPDLTAASAPDGTVTVVFTDIEDSTRLNASFGDRAWLEVLRAHNALITDATDQHGGKVVKGQGDGFMLAFPSARRAVDCARCIERDIAATFDDPGSPIRVRIGVHVGEVAHELDDFFGHAVNYAARVAGAARGGEALVSSLVHELVAPTGEFAFEPPRSVDMKGIRGPQLVYPLALTP